MMAIYNIPDIRYCTFECVGTRCVSVCVVVVVGGEVLIRWSKDLL